MRFVYIIGNGLDISLGLKTGYPDFYKFYLQQPTKDEDVIALKNNIKQHRYETWADLEMGLADYTKELEFPKTFLKCLNNVRAGLKIYISDQFNNKSYDLNPNKIINDLNHPEFYLDPKILTRFHLFAHNYPQSLFNDALYDIITLNYTLVLEDIIPIKYRNNISITHLHGTLTDSMAMGVSSVDQIANPIFRTNEDIVESFVKPRFNDACLNENNEDVQALIDDANIIVIFGTSLGDSDKNWWERIGNRMLQKGNEPLLLYFPFDDKKNVSALPNYKRRWTEEYLQFLLDRIGIPKDRRKDIVDMVCIGINKPIFKLGQRTIPSTKP